MTGHRGIALVLALVVVLLGGAVLVSALLWAGSELRSGRAWSDAAAAEARLQVAVAEVLADRSLWNRLRPGESMARTVGSEPADSTNVIAIRLGDSLGLVSGESWGLRTRTGVGMLVRLTADTAGDSTGIRAQPWRDRAWISLLPP